MVGDVRPLGRVTSHLNSCRLVLREVVDLPPFRAVIFEQALLLELLERLCPELGADAFGHNTIGEVLAGLGDEVQVQELP